MKVATFGFELEFFLRDSAGVFVKAPDSLAAYRDDCGYLVEARGDPSKCPLEARWLMHAAFVKLSRDASAAGLELVAAPTAKLPSETLRLCLREFGKSSAKSYYMYGKCYKTLKPRAGLHIHFAGAEHVAKTDSGAHVSYRDHLNVPAIIRRMDIAFDKEIKQARRVPGEYELKHYGFEYRSLPSGIDLDCVADFLYLNLARSGGYTL